ncbi:rhomboid-related protein 2-like [Macrosteles quadrilineatus]|uniref:rhomboid-related protein 2-like n=1 Tax=Macrosteles quadrilineatus TaxID=74068 RepID=UPI0023E242F0|nr:rhomboid-related protein 2-like [Macrosteles quadrilineatus]
MDTRYSPVHVKPSRRKRTLDKLKTCAPYVPCFICVVGIVQTVLYVLDDTELFNLLLYSPYQREQPWRYISYMLLHKDFAHLALNLGLQTLLAVVLEAEQGWPRTAGVYLLGGLTGSLGTAVLEPDLSMVGSSAGVYALLMAQLPNILYNCDLLRYKWYRIVSVACLCAGDIAYDTLRQGGPVISWSAHVSGAAAGLLLGFTIFVSHNDCSTFSKSLLRYASFVIFMILFVFAILYIYTFKNRAVSL